MTGVLFANPAFLLVLRRKGLWGRLFVLATLLSAVDEKILVGIDSLVQTHCQSTVRPHHDTTGGGISNLPPRTESTIRTRLRTVSF